MANLTKFHLSLVVIISLGGGFLVGVNSVPTSEPLIIERREKNAQVKACREEVEELKSQCANNASEDTDLSIIKSNSTEASLVSDNFNSTSWLKVGRRSLEIAFSGDVKNFLKDVEVPNLFEELKKAKVLGDEQLKVLNGKFSGEINFEEDENEKWNLTLNINGAITDGEPKGDKFIEISKNGRVISRTTGKGRIKNVFTMDADPNVIFAEVNGDDGFIQMYYLPRLDMFTGNYYNKTGMGKFARAGTATLKRL